MASVRMRRWVLTVFIVGFCHCLVSSLYFHVEEGEQKCFVEDVPDDTVLLGRCRTQLYDTQKDEYLPAAPDLHLFVVAKDPDDKVVLSQRFHSKGTFIFTSRQSGGHQICLQSNSSERRTPAGRTLMVHLDMRVGERTNNYTEIAGHEKLTELQLRVRQLGQQVQQILKELNYQRVREKHFQDISHNTNMWIFWWPVVRSLYVVAAIMWFSGSW